MNNSANGIVPVSLKYVSGRCIGGCDINGPPLSMGADRSSQSRVLSPDSHKGYDSYKSVIESLDQLPFDQVVQIGEHTLGKPFKDFIPDEVRDTKT